MSEDVTSYNRRAWDCRVETGCVWTTPVTPEEVARAKAGDWILRVTPTPVPREWLGDVSGRKVLGLAAGGGQQAPILAAAGADVTVFDLSPKQLEQDRFVADRDGLELRCVEGSMTDLGVFDDESFDLIVHPVANLYVEDVNPVWREAYRVLRSGGVLISGFYNPVRCIFDDDKMEQGILEVAHAIPYSDLDSIGPEERAQFDPDDPLAFGHSLDDQLGGQIAAGFALTGFFEDSRGPDFLPDKFVSTYLATRATKL